MVGVDAMQCGFMPVRSIKDAHQLQERYLEKKKQLFLSLEIWRKCLIGSPELCLDD